MKVLFFVAVIIAFVTSNVIAQSESDVKPDFTKTIAAKNFEKDFGSLLKQKLNTEDAIITLTTDSKGAVKVDLYKLGAAFEDGDDDSKENDDDDDDDDYKEAPDDDYKEDPNLKNEDLFDVEEVCKGKADSAFAKCVKAALSKGKSITVWKDEDGKYHAER